MSHKQVLNRHAVDHACKPALPTQQPSLSESFKVLLPLADQWENIGILLGISDRALANVSKKNSTNSLREMLRLWFQDNQPTWGMLADAVQSFDEETEAKLRLREIS